MATMTIKLSGGDLGMETMAVRCDLADAASPVQVDYREGEGWQATPCRAGDVRHSRAGLIEYARRLAAEAVEMDPDEFECDAEEAEEAATVYVVRDAGGEYIRDGYDPDAGEAARRTPAGDEAHEFGSREEAEAARERATDRAFERATDGE